VLGELALGVGQELGPVAPVQVALLWRNPRRNADNTILSCRMTKALGTCSRKALWAEALALESAQREAASSPAQS